VSPYTPQRLPFVRGSETSERAAESMEAHADTLRGRCMTCIRDAGASGATCDEVEEALGGVHQSISARIRELVQLRLIYDTGLTRLTRSGRDARVYAVVD
jgi:hypothetical protein